MSSQQPNSSLHYNFTVGENGTDYVNKLHANELTTANLLVRPLDYLQDTMPNTNFDGAGWASNATGKFYVYNSNLNVWTQYNPEGISLVGRNDLKGNFYIWDGTKFTSINFSSLNQLNQNITNIYNDLANTSDAGKGDALIGVKKSFSNIARNQHSLNQEVISIRDFYNPDSENISVGLQRSIDYISQIYDFGASIFIPQGFYVPNATVNIPVAGNRFKTIFSNGDAIFELSNLNNNPLFNIGGNTSQGNCNTLIDSVLFYSRSSSGKLIYAKNANGLKLQNCRVLDIGIVVDSVDSYAVTINNSYFSGISQYIFISSTGAHHFKFTNNQCYNLANNSSFPNAYPLQFSQSTYNTLIQGNTIEGCRRFGIFNGGGSLNIDSNYIEGCTDNFITSINETAILSSVNFVNNIINGDNGTGNTNTWSMPLLNSATFSNNTVNNQNILWKNNSKNIVLGQNNLYNSLIPKPPMTNTSLLNGHVGNLYYTCVNGIVFIEGSITTATNPNAIINLPDGLRPTTLLRFIAFGNSNTQQSIVLIETNGNIVVESGGFTNVTLSGISFLSNKVTNN